MSSPTLSVVMPNYNHARYLPEAILGIAQQSRPPDEFLILDDASTDNSLDVIARFVKRFPFIRLIRHIGNQGVVAASQRLFAEAKGEFVLSAAADDIRLAGFFERAMHMASRFPTAGLIFGKVAMVDEQGRHLVMGEASRWTEPLFADPQRFLQEYLSVERPSQSPCSGTIYRSDAIREVGGFRAELGSWSDSFAFRAIGLKYGVCYVPTEVAQFRVVQGSFSQQTDRQPKHMLDLLARASKTMRSAEFRDRFPKEFVSQWQRDYRWQVIRDYFLGPEPPEKPRPGFFRRNWRRLPRLATTVRLFFYRGDLSCYDDNPVA